MRRTSAFLAAIGLCLMCSRVHADYTFSDRGLWPENWPKELEPLRKQAGTLEGGLVELVTYRIPFTKREEFEAAWPHILKVKTKGAPVVLLRSPSKHWHFGQTKAGVFIQCPPAHAEKKGEAAGPIPGASNLGERWMWTTYIELVVDGDIVDLNRIPLPADTPIVDLRFEEGDKK